MNTRTGRMQPLTFEDFTRVDIGAGLYYYKLATEHYEITLEPHISAGLTVGIYSNNDQLVSIEKRAVYKYNHPCHPMTQNIRGQLLRKALSVAQYYYDVYVLHAAEVVDPKNTRILPREFSTR